MACSYSHSPIAQLAEYGAVNSGVPGSSPGGGVAERQISIRFWGRGVGWSARVSEEHEVTVRFRASLLEVWQSPVYCRILLRFRVE